MSRKEQNMINEILTTIEQYDTIIVHRHVRSDPDAYGSQGGLVEILRASFPHKDIYAVGTPERTLAYLGQLDEIPDEAYKNALVIVCDTANEGRICDRRYKLGEKIIKIDHHPNEDQYGDLSWVDTNASSTSEMIYELYLAGKEKGLILNAKAARLIFAGIVGDTGRFLFPNTSPKTFRYVSELIRYEFDRDELYNRMYERERNVIKLQGYVMQNFDIRPSGAASIKLKKEDLEKFDVEPAEASLLVNSLRNIKGVVAWCFFIEEEDQIRTRLRSKGPVINTIAKKYNGGGHPLAAGASIYQWEDAEQVMHDLDEVCRHFQQ